MLQKTRGIVLNHIRYAESSLIVRIYTEDFGLQSYIVKGARSKRSGMRVSMFQPMTLLQLVVYHRNNRDLQNIREVSIEEPFHSIASDLRKSTVSIFLAEIIYKAIKEHEANKELFDFLASSLNFFNMQSEGIENFHLYLLVMLSRFMGLQPLLGDAGNHSFFDLREGKFSASQPLHTEYLQGKASFGLYALTFTSASELGSLKLDKPTRDELLNALLLYYQIHLHGMGSIKSLEVLREVFS